MFKKLKDKIEEEFKQSPLRQQIAQVISKSPSSTSLNESKNSDSGAMPLPDALAVPSDFFSISDDHDVGENSRDLHTVDLTASSPSIMPARSRRDSLNSIASDVSSLYPIYESPLSHSYLQSDLESELDENTLSQLDKVTKERLFQGYKKLLYRYNKYKGRYVDLSRQLREVQHENMKTKNVLLDSQDKALRRMAELREQCQLEQKAKAHLEDSLRNDLEERDHIIATLNTKIGLLKSGENTEDLMKLDDDSNLQMKNSELCAEVVRLKHLLDASSASQPVTTNGPALESTEQVKEKITQLKSGIVRMKSENENISNLLSKSPCASECSDDTTTSLIDLSAEADEKDKRIEKQNQLLLKCKVKITALTQENKEKNGFIAELNEKIAKLTEESDSAKNSVVKLESQLSDLRKESEENALTIAENKMVIHKELETKEQLIKQLSTELEESRSIERELKAKAESKLNHYEKEIMKLKEAVTKATEVKNDVLLKLKQEKENGKIESQRLVESEINLGKEKQKLQSFIEAFLGRHQEKLNEIVGVVENKLNVVEGNLARLCADRLIERRKVELELRENISRLETEAANERVQETGNGSLENQNQVQHLEELVSMKDGIIVEKCQNIDKLNLELSEKIDRIVILGDEIEELKNQKKLITESVDGKIQEINQLKSKTDEEYEKLEQTCQKLLQDLEFHKTQAAEFESTKTELSSVKSELTSVSEANNKLVKESQSLLNQIKELERKNEEISKELGSSVHLQRDLEILRENVVKLENEKDYLESRKKESLEKYSRLQEEFRNSQEIWKAEKENLEKERNDLVQSQNSQSESKIKSLETALTVKNEEFDALSSQKTLLEKEIAKFRAQCNTQIEKLELVEKDLKCKETDYRESIEKLKNTSEQKLKELSEEKEVLQTLLAEKDSEIAASASEIERYETNISEIKKELSDSKSKLDIVKSELSQKLEDITKEKDTLLEDIKSLNLEHENCKKELETSKQLLSNSYQDIQAIKLELENKNQSCDILEKQLEESSKTSRDLIESLTSDVNGYIEKLATVGEDHLSKTALLQQKVLELESSNQNLSTQLESIKDFVPKESLEEIQSKLNLLTDDHKNEVERLVNELNLTRKELTHLKTAHEENSAKLKEENGSKVTILKKEIEYLKEKYEEEVKNIEENRERELSEMKEKLEHSEKMADELLKKLETTSAQKEDISQSLSEKTMKVTELEGCMSSLKADLDRNFNEMARSSGLELEEVYEGKLKKLVSEYELELSKRDETIRDMELNASESADLLQTLPILRAELKSLRQQLKEKDDLIEVKTEEFEGLKKETENQIINLKIDNTDLMEAEAKLHEDKIEKLKEEYETRLETERNKYEELVLEERKKNESIVENERGKWENEFTEAKEHWAVQKKHDTVDSMPASVHALEELECTSKIAVAAVETSAESLEVLRQQIMQQSEEIKELKKQHKREMSELGKLAALRSRRASERERDGDDVEHEYLRNILYKYMMGQEQMVLAKVLAAIVKFDHQQTHNILERQSSMNGLRIL